MKDFNETTTTEELIRGILDGSKETIKSNIVDGLKKQIIENLSWSMREHISKVTNEFVETELKDEIKNILIESKPAIMESLKDSFIKIGASVAQAMYENAAKNLNTNSYSTKEILKKILD
jgi:glutathionyl-hydroquinone reductase